MSQERMSDRFVRILKSVEQVRDGPVLFVPQGVVFAVVFDVDLDSGAPFRGVVALWSSRKTHGHESSCS